jgi:hypothetical protein
MQNEATNTIQERLLKNSHFAHELRKRLLTPRGRAKQGYLPDDPFYRILFALDDEQLVSKYIAHSVIEAIPIDRPQNRDIVFVQSR